MAVHDLVVKDDDLVVATNGRSIWILDDLTPIREWNPNLAAKKRCCSPRRRRCAAKSGAANEPYDRSAGENPPNGAVLTYYLADKPKKPITLEIVDLKGQRVALLDSKEEKKDDDEDVGAYSEGEEKKKKPLPADKGFNRFGWDLKYKGATPIPKARVDAGDAEDGPLALPGEYKLKLTVDGQVLVAELTIRPDLRRVESEAYRFVPLLTNKDVSERDIAEIRECFVRPDR